ncbi:hypothetical protein ACFQH3_12135 [Haladaptatus sp. GCM10025707]|uniref:hypothetical protein n=1 Tax=unclassified Haladaptatus TaxID=2622732 RepID=UPI0023E88920|nr:hypothetical protein [Haladaptatus sp. QDMS2]
MTFDERLRELHQQGDHDQARTLAKAVLRNEAVTRVEVSPELVRVETPHFRGTHRIAVDQVGVMSIQHHGTYQYKSQEIDLSFATKTMNQAAYDQAVAHLTDQTKPAHDERKPNAETTARPDASPPNDENRSVDDPDDTSPNPVAFLKQLF